MKTEKVSALIGIFITVCLSSLSYLYLDYKSTTDIQKSPNKIYETIEALDLRYNDIKYKLRDPKSSESKIALIAIDDDSLQEIGRWPWDRDLIAKLTENALSLGATSVGFDAIFSEPQKGNLEADAAFSAVVQKYPDKIILGTFSESQGDYKPYQDYCISEAFLTSRGNEIVKLNPTFVVDDSATASFDDLDWAPLFKIIFQNIKSEQTQSVLKELGKKDVSELSQFQKNYLESSKTKSIFRYCSQWLTNDDIFLQDGIREKVIPLYESVYKKNTTFQSLSFDQFISELKSKTPIHPVPQYGEWTPNIPELQEPSTYTASFNAKLDSDGYVRKYPLFYRSGNKLGSSFIPSLALQSYLVANSYRADVKLEKGKSAFSEKRISSFTIMDTKTEPEMKVVDLPVDQMGQLLVNYYGPAMTLPYISAKELLSDSETIHVQMNTFDKNSGSNRKISIVERNKKEFLKDRTLLFGATAIGVYDLRNIPIEPNYPGPEIHMSMLANLMDKNFLFKWNNEDKILPLITLALGIGLTFLLSYMGSIQSLVTLGVLFSLILIVDLFIFFKLSILTSGFLILIETSFISFGIIVYKYFTEEKKKKELKSTFSKYVSPAVVDELLKDAENLKLGGKRTRMSVFFSDVRGFTTISEKLTPEELSRVLNMYLTPMTEIVFKNSGTLDKYMGDAIMAFFGAPIQHPQHAHHACRCALESIEKLWELQKEFKEKGLPNIDIGIGINTGDMSVGNMGSNIVQNYTVMGDSVNLASRLEGINKEYGTRIIISEFTFEDVKDQFSAREVDRVKVKGKNEPVRIFELMKEGTLEGTQKEMTDEFNLGYKCYHSKKFAEGIEHFKKGLEKIPNDPVCELYIERCQDYLQDPPPENWDGVYVMKTK